MADTLFERNFQEAIEIIRANEKYNQRLFEEKNAMLYEMRGTDYMMQLKTGLISIGFETMFVK